MFAEEAYLLLLYGKWYENCAEKAAASRGKADAPEEQLSGTVHDCHFPQSPVLAVSSRCQSARKERKATTTRLRAGKHVVSREH